MKPDIVLPYLHDLDEPECVSVPLLVSRGSPMSLKKALETISDYLSCEIEIIFPQYSAIHDGRKETVESYLWLDCDITGVFPIGGCSFNFIVNRPELPPHWLLNWVWIHPYYRNKGILSKSWNLFKNLYDDNFKIEKPLSKSMEHFLRKQNGKA